MSNFYDDNADIRFHVEKKIDFNEIFRFVSASEKEGISASTAEEYRATWLDIISTLGKLVGDEIAPNARTVETQGVHLNAAGEVVRGAAL